MTSAGLSRNVAPEADVLANMLIELRNTERRVADLERELAGRMIDIHALESLVRETETREVGRLGALERQLAEAEGRIQAIFRSRTWRIMGPYRRLARSVRRVLRR